MHALNAMIVSMAGSPWILAIVLLLVIVDGFFPPVPSETVIVALGTVGAATGLPNPWLVFLVAALGSFLGDNIAFLIGRRVEPSRFPLLRGRRLTSWLGRARASLDRRPAAVILTARFIPVGRVAVNVLAGASGFPRRRFLTLTAVSGGAWTAYSLLIGIVAGSWIHNNALLGVGAAVATASVVGLLVDRLGHLRARHTAQHQEKSVTQPHLRGTRVTS